MRFGYVRAAMIETLDTTVRLVSVGVTLLLLVLLLAGEVRRPIKFALAGLLIGAIAYLINSSTEIHPTGTIRPFVDLASLLTPLWTWLFGRRLFEHEPPRTLLIGVLVVIVAAWFGGSFIERNNAVGFYVIHIVSLALVVDLVKVAFQDRADDLVEKRRMIRLWLPLLVAAQAGGILLFETIVGRAIPYPPVQLANALLILALTLFAGLALLRTDPELLVETESHEERGEPPSDLSPAERVLSEDLEAAMEQGYYRTPGLTIAALADHLGVPEHRLRALINRRLGHRNFAAYLNRHRVAEAKQILADREQVSLPVLTIAMDLGYNSLPTFNRAFRTETSMTPTEYRRDALSENAEQN